MDPLVANYNISWNYQISKISYALSRYDPRLNFICRFTPLTDESLLYEISWYVDDTEVIKGQTVNLSTIENALLPAMAILENNKTAGSMIQFVVGIKSTANGSSCATNASQPFFAGIKVLTPQLFIDIGGKADILLQLTIPYAAENLVIYGQVLETTDLLVRAYIPQNSSLYCVNSSFKYDSTDRRCEIRIKGYSYNERDKYESNIWKQVYKMTIYEQGNAFRNLLERGITLPLKTSETHGEGSKIFSNIHLPDIQVYTNRSYSIQSTSTTTIPIQDCATKSSTHTFPKTTTMTTQLNDSMIMTNIISATKIATQTMTSTPTKTATQTSATQITTETMTSTLTKTATQTSATNFNMFTTRTSSNNESVRTTTQSAMNSTLSDCFGINRNNSEVLNSKENCDLLVTSTSEQLTVPGYVFIVLS
ncbi:uncharacterized protein LOC134279469 [Saccostrea cucullata]|uniref:uncharacterized protein LOC134279469 n=1 Tax=Saccostrea cuccullata TaxID=36930 RepID=UPI002ED2F419